jgi:hypothetical protein
MEGWFKLVLKMKNCKKTYSIMKKLFKKCLINHGNQCWVNVMKVDFQIKFQNETKCSHFNQNLLKYNLNFIFEEINKGP